MRREEREKDEKNSVIDVIERLIEANPEEVTDAEIAACFPTKD